MNTTVIIPAWNMWEMSMACLISLAECSPAGLIQVLVADNGSTDRTARDLESFGHGLFSENFKRLRFEENLGFAKACNAGAREANGDYLFFLNNDVIMRPGWLEPLLNCFERRSNLGAAGPLLLYPDRKKAGFPGNPGIDDPSLYGVQHCGVAFTPDLAMRHIHAYFPAAHPLVKKRRSLQAITGAAMFMPKKIFQETGGFHEGYINGFEDLDFCFQLRRKGFSVACEAKSVIFHLAGQTFGRNLHDKNNAALANARNHDVKPDMHKMLADDGLRPALNHNLEIYARIDQEQEKNLNIAFVPFFDIERCRRRLEDQPLWFNGYDLMAQALEKKNQWSAGAAWRLLQARLFPIRDLVPGLLRSLPHLDDKNLFEHIKETAMRLSIEQDPTFLRKKAEALIRWSKAAGERDLERLYVDWLNANNQI